MVSIPFCSFGGYRRFNRKWWAHLWWWVSRGWVYDIRMYWHRARYGWAPRDTWSLDSYVAGVLGGSLNCLSETGNGTPEGYPHRPAKVMVDGVLRDFDDKTDDINAVVTDHDLWRADLARWGAVFTAYTTDDYYELYCKGEVCDHDAWNRDETARYDAVRDALRELTPWFGALWS